MTGMLINPYRFATGGGGTGYDTEVLADSPLAYWRLGESSGTSAADSSGNGRNATYTNSPTLGVTGLLNGDTNKAVQLAVNTGQCVSIASATWMDAATLTFEALVKFTTAVDAGNGDPIVSRYTSAGGFTWMLWRNTSGKLAVQVRNGSGTFYNVASASNAADNTRYHVAGTVTASAITLYVDGTQVATGAFAGGIQASTSPIEIGRYSQAASTVPGAIIDEVAVYGSALSGARIGAHYAAS